MSNQNNNIFLTFENFAFSLPLLAVCSTYAYFKYVPLEYGLPIVGGVVVLAGLRSKLKSRKAHKLQNLDETYVQELVGDEDNAAASNKKIMTKAQKATQKKKQQVAARLRAEKKKGAANDNDGDDDDDDDDDALLANFAKGGKKKKK